MVAVLGFGGAWFAVMRPSEGGGGPASTADAVSRAHGAVAASKKTAARAEAAAGQDARSAGQDAPAARHAVTPARGGSTRDLSAPILRELARGNVAVLLFVADREHVAAAALGALRLELGRRFDLIPAGRHDILWMVDFPMFGFNEEEQRWDPLHHPFTAPLGSFDDPGLLRSRAYDLVVDGWELGGGSIRIHEPETQRQVFQAIGLGEEEAQRRFGFLLEAMRYGAPPHGGIAMGIDRIVALIAARDSIRDVIAFPKTASGSDPLTGAPAPVDERQLRELGVKSLVQPPPPAAG